MEKKPTFLKCYTAAFDKTLSDSYLKSIGFAGGMISFAVPDYGVLFRCRAHGAVLDLEFGAFFALLRFIKTRLADQKIDAVQVLSSNPEFVFSFTGDKEGLAHDKDRLRMLTEYSRQFTLAVGYVKPVENRSLLSPTNYASLPTHAHIALRPDPAELQKSGFKSIRKGIWL